MKKQFLPLLICTLLFASCELWETNTLSFDRETFEKERQLWQEQDLQNYSFHLLFVGNAIGNWSGTVVVRDGVLFDFVSDDLFLSRYNSSGDGPEPDPVVHRPEIMKWIVPFPGIYNNIDDDSQPSEGRGRHTILKAEYDSVYHFPQEYSFSSTPSFGGSGSWELYTTNFTLDPEKKQYPVIFDQETFDAEYQLWLEQDLRDYSFDLHFRSRDEREWKGTVTVRDGVLSEFVTDPGCRHKLEELSTEEINLRYPYDYWGWLNSISGIYDIINNDSQDKKKGWDWWRTEIRLYVEYDSEFHFPKWYHYHAMQQGSVFIEHGGWNPGEWVEISNFTIDTETGE